MDSWTIYVYTYSVMIIIIINFEYWFRGRPWCISILNKQLLDTLEMYLRLSYHCINSWVIWPFDARNCYKIRCQYFFEVEPRNCYKILEVDFVIKGVGN